MKRLSILLTSLVALSLMIAACSSTGQTPGASGPETAYPLGTPSEGLSTQAPMTEAPTMATTEPSATEAITTETPSSETTQPITGTGALPSTGSIDPGLVSNLMDFDVYNGNNEQVGSVNDLVVNLDDLKVDYVIVGAGGFLGLGEKNILVPWDSMELSISSTMTDTMNSTPNSFILDISQDDLSQAPEVDPNSIPAIGEESAGWDAEYQSYWQNLPSAGNMVTGTAEVTNTPAATEMPEVASTPSVSITTGMTETMALHGVVLASKLAGADIQTSDGQDLGKIANGVVDDNTGQVEYVIINTAEGGQWVPVPLQAIGWDSQNEAFVLTVDQSVFMDAPSFTPDRFPDTQQQDWDADLQNYWKDYTTPVNQ
jgi:sporulation protein YlmC with PRC-barrel domain